MIAAIADRIVAVVRAGHRRRAWLSAGALIMTLVVAVGYLSLGALQVNPLASTYRVTIELPESAGLLPNQDVTLRGVRIGRVDRLDITPAGVNAVVNVNSSVPIPESSDVRVSGLSPAGEQYIDFVAQSNDGPYLRDGAVITQGRATVPVSLAQLLANADSMLAQVDTAKIELIKRELSLSKDGPAQARRHHQRRHFPAVHPRLGAAGDHQRSAERPRSVHARRRQERRNRRRRRQSQRELYRDQQDAGRLSQTHK